jgi:hypothetical protein
MKLGWRALLVLLIGGGGTTGVMAAPSCYPNPDTNGSPFWNEMNAAGWAVLWYCKEGNGWKPVTLMGHWNELDSDWLYQVPKLLYGTKTQKDAAWARTNNATDYTQTVKPLLATLRAAHDAQYPVVGPTCKITRQSATVLDRAVYKLKSAGALGSAITGVRVLQGTPCGARFIEVDASGNLHLTNYYSVAGQKDTMGRVIAAGYAIGVVN